MRNRKEKAFGTRVAELHCFLLLLFNFLFTGLYNSVAIMANSQLNIFETSEKKSEIHMYRLFETIPKAIIFMPGNKNAEIEIHSKRRAKYTNYQGDKNKPIYVHF